MNGTQNVKNNMSTKEKNIEEIDEIINNEYQLIVHNDDYNSFQNVIISLMTYCNHSVEQAENCAIVVHHKGSCVVDAGDFDDILHKKSLLQNNGLTVSME